jgi:ABC-type antimicrobial peptide transport system permease subunit
MVAVIMVIMALAQTIISFNANEVIQAEMIKSEQTSLLANKIVDEKLQSELDKTYRVAIDETDIRSFYDAGYQGKIYPVYNTTFSISSTRNYFGVSSANFSTHSKEYYLNESFGTLAVDEEFLERKFGKVEYLAYAKGSYGLIITDYLADACLLSSNGNYRGKTYQDLVGRYVPATWTYSNMTVKAVIKTNYKERHKAFFEKAKQNVYKTTEDMYNDADFLAFLNEIYDCLGYSYSLDPNYEQNSYLDYAYFSHYKLVCEGGGSYPDNYANPSISFFDAPSYTKDLGAGEASMSMKKYNEIFGTDYTSATIKNFEPRKLKISSYAYNDLNNEKPLFTTEIMVKKLHTASDTFIFSETASPEQRKFFGQATMHAYGLYFDGAEGIGMVLEKMEELNYKSQGSSVEGIRMMTRAVEVFIPIFELVAIILCVGVIFILVSFSSKMINDKMKEIGILKALGVKNTPLSLIFGLQVLLIALLTCFMATAGQYLFIDLANDVLIESLKKLASSYIVMDLQFLTFQPDIAIANCLLIAVLSSVSLVFPMVKIKEIKPVKIIKARE